MSLPEWCPAKLATRDTTFCAVSRAPQPKLDAYRNERGWPFAYYSSYGSDFNVDLGVTGSGSWGADTYNFAPIPAEHGGDGERAELPGTSVFLRDGARVFHTYSMYARGAEQTGGSYYFLDLTALGRQEEWEIGPRRGAAPVGPRLRGLTVDRGLAPPGLPPAVRPWVSCPDAFAREVGQGQARRRDVPA